MDHSAPGIVVLSSIMIAVTILSIIIRFWSRYLSSSANYGWDDLFALIATPMILAVPSLGIYQAQKFLGKHIDDMNPQEIAIGLKIFYAGSLLFEFGLTFTKLSALAFYIRILGWKRNNSLWWRGAFSFTLFVTFGWPIFGISEALAQCRPIKKYWLPETPGHCIGQLDNNLSAATINVINDALILLLPLPPLFNLHMRAGKKLLVLGLIIIGSSIPLMSVGRMVVIVKAGNSYLTDFFYAVVPEGYFLIAEPPLSVLAICMPAMFQLVKRVHEFGFISLVTKGDMSQHADHSKHSHSTDGSGSHDHNTSDRRRWSRLADRTNHTNCGWNTDTSAPVNGSITVSLSPSVPKLPQDTIELNTY